MYSFGSDVLTAGNLKGYVVDTVLIFLFACDDFDRENHLIVQNKVGGGVKMFKLLSPIVALMLLWAGTARAYDIQWAGCVISKKGYMEAVAMAYEQATGHKVALGGGGATKGIRAVVANTAEVGGTCRPPLKDANGHVHGEEKGAEMVPVAWDALVVTVHASNPLNTISLANLKKIFQGEIENWQALGWHEDRPIALVDRDERDAGTPYLFRRLVFNDPDIVFKARSLKEKSGTMDKRVEKMVAGLAIDGVSSARKNPNIKILSLDEVEPSKANIASGRYPLFRPLFLVLSPQSPPEARELVQFVLSPAGQQIISDQGILSWEEGKALIPLWQEKTAKYGL